MTPLFVVFLLAIYIYKIIKIKIVIGYMCFFFFFLVTDTS